MSRSVTIASRRTCGTTSRAGTTTSRLKTISSKAHSLRKRKTGNVRGVTHLNVWQEYQGGENLVFRGNIVRGEKRPDGQVGVTPLLFEHGYPSGGPYPCSEEYRNVLVENNLFVDASTGYVVMLFNGEGVTYRYNTVVGGEYGTWLNRRGAETSGKYFCRETIGSARRTTSVSGPKAPAPLRTSLWEGSPQPVEKAGTTTSAKTKPRQATAPRMGRWNGAQSGNRRAGTPRRNPTHRPATTLLPPGASVSLPATKARSALSRPAGSPAPPGPLRRWAPKIVVVMLLAGCGSQGPDLEASGASARARCGVTVSSETGVAAISRVIESAAGGSVVCLKGGRMRGRLKSRGACRGLRM